MHSDDEDLSIRIFERADTERVIALWIEAFPSYSERSAPHRDPRFAIEMKLATQPELFFVALRGAPGGHRDGGLRRPSRLALFVRGGQ